MAWDQISITVPHEFVEPISHVFERYGHGVGIQSLNKLDAEIQLLYDNYISLKNVSN